MLAILLSSGCVWTQNGPTLNPQAGPPNNVEQVEAEVSPRLSPPPDTEPRLAATPEGMLIVPSEPNVELERAEGLTTAQAQALSTQTRDALERCGTAGGILRLRFTAEGARAHIEIDPSSTWDHQARECALQMLSISELDEMIENARAPDERPLRMYSQIVISWP
jgi:hypothetical protein